MKAGDVNGACALSKSSKTDKTMHLGGFTFERRRIGTACEVFGAADGAVVGGITYHGVVARYMGDGVLVYFGYPHAHEDDAEQATRAGLALVDAMPKLQKNVDVALQVRIGIATGIVVVGDLLIGEGSEERAVVGDTPNLAARLQTLAAPGTVLICPSTRTSITAISALSR